MKSRLVVCTSLLSGYTLVAGCRVDKIDVLTRYNYSNSSGHDLTMALYKIGTQQPDTIINLPNRSTAMFEYIRIDASAAPFSDRIIDSIEFVYDGARRQSFKCDTPNGCEGGKNPLIGANNIYQTQRPSEELIIKTYTLTKDDYNNAQ